MDDTIFITSALPYVNNVPHLGNIVGSVLSGDLCARFNRKMGKKVLYLCGTDEYGTTTEVKALQEKLTCQEICDKYHKLHKEVYNWFNISFDVFGRTTTTTQTELSQQIFLNLLENGHIEEKEIEEYKCTNCDIHLADRYIIAKCYHKGCDGIANGDQCDKCGNLIEGDKIKEIWCSLCNKIPIKIKTKHLYIKLGDFEKDIRDTVLDEKKTFLTNNARSITETWMKMGLESRCITRNLKWGTPVPDIMGEEYKKKVFYVWFDAPIGYLSILKHGREDWNEWLKGKWIQFMAKDNVPFHTIIFPATLLGSKLFPLLTDLSCTEYLNHSGQKFSKSKNIGVFGDEVAKLSKELNIDEDYWRYYLMKIRPVSSDSSFSWKDFSTIIKGELAQKVGNFINRLIAMTTMFYVKGEKKGVLKYELDDENYKLIENIIKEYINEFTLYNYHEGIRRFNRMAELGNLYINEKQIYNICKLEPDKNEIIMGNALFIAWIVGELAEPIMPNKSKRIKQLFNNKNSDNALLNLPQKGEIEFSFEDTSLLFNQIKEDEFVRVFEMIKQNKV